MKYAESENIRNKGKFHVHWNIDDQALEYETVKFIIQPVLENSIFHGLMNSPQKDKNIIIDIHTQGDSLIVSINDNGVGISASALSEINARLAQSNIQENIHIGLCNVDMRIKLLFGDDCGVSIVSVEGEGTTVTIVQRLLKGKFVNTSNM
jgi:two-component system sensor histidine kinase YesM